MKSPVRLSMAALLAISTLAQADTRTVTLSVSGMT